MTRMRLALIALGALFVAAVWLFNKVQERRVRRTLERSFSGPADDVLMGVASGTEAFARTEPRFTLPPEPPAGGAPLAPPEAPAIVVERLDEEVNAVIDLAIEQPVSGERVLACLQGLRHAGKLPVAVYGAVADGWAPVEAGARYEALVAAIQLANRSGPLNEIDFSEFVARLQHAAEQIPATCEAPEMAPTIARARSLDSRCASLDAQIGLNIARPDGTWSGEQIAQAARECGMLGRADGRFWAIDADATELFCLQIGEGAGARADTLPRLQVDRVTLILDIPRVPQDRRPYERMTQTAQVLVHRLGGMLVDDALRTLTPAMLAGIERQLVPVYERLAAAGMPAGSPRAKVLFR